MTGKAKSNLARTLRKGTAWSALSAASTAGSFFIVLPATFLLTKPFHNGERRPEVRMHPRGLGLELVNLCSDRFQLGQLAHGGSLIERSLPRRRIIGSS